MAKNSLQKLLDASAQFGEMTRQQAEATVKKLVKAGAIRRSETEHAVQTMLDRGRAFAEAVQQEVTKQLGWLASRVDDLEGQLESMVSRMSPGGGPAPAKKAPAKKAAAKKAPAKKAPAKKAAAKRAPAKKTAAKKAPAKRAPAKRATAKRTTAKRTTAKRAPAKKAVGSSGVRKVATTRPA
jgi:polyhydroxyalkanoate synthesis regulator phasin